ncbi:MAG: hypothetical protein AAFV95_22860 [Bacteroidota bacterium]
MKRLTLFIPLILFFFASVGLQAQTDVAPETAPEAPATEMAVPKPPKKSKKDRAERKVAQDAIVAKLNLNDAQQQQFEKINKDYHKKMKSIRMAKGGDPQTRKQQMQELRKDHNKELKAVLTAEQFKTYKDLSKEKRQGRQGGAKRGNFGPGN